MTIGADEVLRGALDAKAREYLPVEVVESAGSGLAGQVVDGQRQGSVVLFKRLGVRRSLIAS